MSALVALVVLLQAGTPDPMQILRSAGDTYRKSKSYQLEMVVTKPADGQGAGFRQTLVGVRPSKYREELSLPIGTLIRVSDGITVWAYMPDAGCYVSAMVGASEATRPPFVPVANEDIFGSYAELAQRTKSAKWLRTETVVVGKKRILCDVVRVEEQAGTPAYPDPQADRQWRGEWLGDSSTTYWIGRTSRLVLKELARSPKGSQLLTEFRLAVVDSAIADATFRFVPPEGVRRCRPEDLR